jgi:hypothetical protein
MSGYAARRTDGGFSQQLDHVPLGLLEPLQMGLNGNNSDLVCVDTNSIFICV